MPSGSKQRRPHRSASRPASGRVETEASAPVGPKGERALSRYGKSAIVPGRRPLKPLFWVGSSKRDLRKFPEEVKDVLGYTLHVAQLGGKHVDAKPLRGFGGTGVLEVVEDSAGDTYRAIYTVKFADAVYALHVFQKKSKSGVKTPQRHMDLIRERLKRAEAEHASWSKSRG